MDLAFAAAALPETGAAPAMDVALFTEPYVLVAPTGHRFKGRKAVAVEELDGEPFVARTHCEYRQILAAILKQAGVRPRIAYRTDQDERALALVRSGLGIAVVPEHYGARGVLKLAFAGRHFSRTVGLRWRPERRSPAADRFVEFCRTADWR